MKTKWMTVLVFTIWAAIISIFAAKVYEKYGISFNAMAAASALATLLLIVVGIFEEKRINKLNELEDYEDFNTESETMIKK